MEELINLVVGKYRIKLYKHKLSKTTGVFNPYELIISINMAFSGERPQFMETYHVWHSTKKDALDVIKLLPTDNCSRR